MTEDLFAASDVPDGVTRPLAVRMRPTSLDEVVGQAGALAEGSPLRRLADPASAGSLTAPSSVLLFGPPGVGKTTLAHIVARRSGREFEELSAVTSGVKDVRAVLKRAHERLVTSGRETVLFIDEVHRFSKSQQDALLPSVENRDVTFIGATTENPSFSVISALLSRSVVVRLDPLSDADLRILVMRAVADPRGLEGRVDVEDEAVDQIVRMSGGDGRKALTILEAAAGAVTEDAGGDGADGVDGAGSGRPLVTPDVVSRVMDVATVRYDRDGDDHYDVASAFIKSMRGSDPDAALHYLARMLRAGEDPRFIARRIMIASAEEVGMAAPQILQVTVAAAQAVALIGMPEARIILSEAVLAVATAPKSNASYLAIDAALADVDAGHVGPVPRHLRNAPTSLMKSWGNHQGYVYAHDAPGAVAAQQYMPDDLVGREYYHPNDRGYERELGPRLDHVRSILRSAPRRPESSDTSVTPPRVPIGPRSSVTQSSGTQGREPAAPEPSAKRSDDGSVGAAGKADPGGPRKASSRKASGRASEKTTGERMAGTRGHDGKMTKERT